MGGVCCVLQPWNEDFHPTLQEILLGYFLSASLGILMMFNVIIVSHFKFLQDQDNHKTAIFWMLLLGISLSICISLAFEKPVINCSWADWLMILGHSGAYIFILPLEIYYSSRLPGVVISVTNSSSIIYVSIAQYTFLSHIHSGYMNWIEICGICVVTISSIFPSVVKAITEKDNMDGIEKEGREKH